MYYLKDVLVGPPKIYLGAEIKKYQVNSGKYCWSIPSTHYMKNTIKTIEVLLKSEYIQLKRVNSSVNDPFRN